MIFVGLTPTDLCGLWIWRAADVDDKFELILVLLLDSRYTIDQYAFAASFHFACRAGRADIVRILLSDRRVVLSPEDMAHGSSTAAANGHSDVSELVCRSDRLSFLEKAKAAAAAGQIALVDELIMTRPEACDRDNCDHGAQCAEEFGRTVLFHASRKCQFPLLERILDDDRVSVTSQSLGATVHDIFSGNVLRARNYEVLRILMTHRRVSVDSADLQDNFMDAARRNDTLFATIVLQNAGFCRTRTSAQFSDALFVATIHESWDMVRLLLADPRPIEFTKDRLWAFLSEMAPFLSRNTEDSNAVLRDSRMQNLLSDIPELIRSFRKLKRQSPVVSRLVSCASLHSFVCGVQARIAALTWSP